MGLSETVGLAGWNSPVASEARQGFQDRSRGKKGTQESLTTQAVKTLPPPHAHHLRMGYSEFQRLEGYDRHEHDRNKPGWDDALAARSVAATGGDGYWGTFDLIRCTDGKARRIEPGTFPLVARLPKGVVCGGDSSLPINPQATAEGRVMRLKGYGNAIVPQLASEFIKAFLET